MNLLGELKRSFTGGSILIKIVYINLAVFVFSYLFDAFISDEFTSGYFILGDFLGVPSSGMHLVMRFWTLLTYMFTHFDFLHILFNLLWLYWFGVIFLQHFSNRHFLGLYLLGGISGAVFYILTFNMIPDLMNINSYAIGASASVTAIVIATAFYKPNMILNLMFIGAVKLKYIAMFVIALDVMNIFVSFSSTEALYNNNIGGHIAHIGGAVYGYFYMVRLKKGHDIAKGFNNVTEKIFALFGGIGASSKTKSDYKDKFRVKYKQESPRPSRNISDIEYNTQKKVTQDEIDKILEKISKSGYESLTKEEKDKLFRMSQK